MKEIKIKDEYIKLEQAMKLCGACSSGSDAKYYILRGDVKVNGEEENRRGKKLRDGDIFSFNNQEYKIISAL